MINVYSHPYNTDEDYIYIYDYNKSNPFMTDDMIKDCLLSIGYMAKTYRPRVFRNTDGSVDIPETFKLCKFNSPIWWDIETHRIYAINRKMEVYSMNDIDFLKFSNPDFKIYTHSKKVITARNYNKGIDEDFDVPYKIENGYFLGINVSYLMIERSFLKLKKLHNFPLIKLIDELIQNRQIREQTKSYIETINKKGTSKLYKDQSMINELLSLVKFTDTDKKEVELLINSIGNPIICIDNISSNKFLNIIINLNTNNSIDWQKKMINKHIKNIDNAILLYLNKHGHLSRLDYSFEHIQCKRINEHNKIIYKFFYKN